MRRIGIVLVVVALVTGYSLVANSVLMATDGSSLSDPQPQLTSSGRVLIYYGNSGVGPDDVAGPAYDFFTLQAFYESLGLTVEYTDQWPFGLSSPATYTLVILLAPGHDTGDQPWSRFSIGQKVQLDQFLQAGGHLVVLSDDSSFTGQAVENDLLADLHVPLAFNSNSWADGLGDQITPDCLTNGVGVLNTDQWTDVTIPWGTATPGALVLQNASADPATNLPAGMMMASDVPPHGAGRVTIIGDLNLLDDASALGDFNWPANNDNVAFNFAACFTTVSASPPPPAPCYDFDGSGVVDLGDVLLLVNLWRQEGVEPPLDCDGDGTIDIRDILCVLGHLGERCS